MCACVCLDSVGMCVRKSCRQSLLQAQSVCDGRWGHTWCWSIHGICSLESFVLLSFIFIVLVQRCFLTFPSVADLQDLSSGNQPFFFVRLVEWRDYATFITESQPWQLCSDTAVRWVSYLRWKDVCYQIPLYALESDLFLSKHTLVFKFIFPFKCMRISIFADSCR